MTLQRLFIVCVAAVLPLALFAGPAVADDFEIEEETEVTLDQLPAAARSAIEAEVAGAAIDELETGLYNGQRVYEVEFERNGEELEFIVAEDGTILGWDD